MFLFFFNYSITETRKNSEKNYTNVSLDGRCSSSFGNIFSPNLITKKIFFKQIDFLKNLRKIIVVDASITQN